MAKSQSDSSRVRQDQPESIIEEYDHAFLRGVKHNPRQIRRSQISIFVRAPGGRAFHGVRARPFAQGRRRQLMRKLAASLGFVYIRSRHWFW